jgi:hypothetical protein
MEQVRKFKCKAIELLIIGETIATVAATHVEALAKRRAAFTLAYFDELKTNIDKAYTDVLGVDNAQPMKDATQLLGSMMKPAKNDLVDFNKQLTFDFRKNATRLKQLKDQLGFTTHYAKLKSGDQENFIQLLAKFKTNMLADTKTEILTQGTDANLIDRILGYANTLKNANVTQEVGKILRKELTQQDISTLNDLYDQLILINNIARRSNLSDTVKKTFSFPALLKNLNNHGTTTPPDTDNTPPTN